MLLFQPALLVHFALVFPERRGWIWPKLLATYTPPVGLLILPDGSLLVSDDGGNKIWRVAYR